MPSSICFVLTSQGELGSSGRRTGVWLEELAAPYWRLADEGVAVRLASPRGGPAPLDPMSLEEQWLTADGRRFLASEEAQRNIANTETLTTIAPDSIDGIFLVGGVGAAWDFPLDAALRALVEDQFRRDGLIGAICHGVAGLLGAIDANGEPVVKNRQITGISNAEDEMMGVDKIVPVLPETGLRKLRALYTAAGPLAPHVVCDPPFFTGQNPSSAAPLAERMAGHLRRS